MMDATGGAATGIPDRPNGVENEAERPSSGPREAHPLENMSMVSPPFTPSQSVVDLVHGSVSLPPHLSLDANDEEGVATQTPLESNESGLDTELNPERKSEVQNALSDELPQVFCESRARIPTTVGTEIFLHVYRNNIDSKEHLAIVFGDDIHSKTLFAPRAGETELDRMTRGAYSGKLYPGRESSAENTEASAGKKANEPDVLCRIHSECYTGETAWSARCDCGEQLDEAARLMSVEGRGVIVYLRQEGRGIGLGEKLKAYNLQDLGADTVQANLMLRHPADGRSFSLATAILLDLGLDHIRLLTNNPDKIAAVEGRNQEVTVTQRVPMIPLSWQNRGGFQSKDMDRYLATKIERMGHLLDSPHPH